MYSILSKVDVSTALLFYMIFWCIKCFPHPLFLPNPSSHQLPPEGPLLEPTAVFTLWTLYHLPSNFPPALFSHLRALRYT